MYKEPLLFCILIFTAGTGYAEVMSSTKIDEVRNTCDILTNESVKEIQGYKITKRKDQLLNHVHQLCEHIEMLYDENQWTSSEVQQDSQDLNLILQSWLRRFAAEEGVGLFGILEMGIYHDLSPWFLRFDVPTGARNTEASTVPDSIFWKNPTAPRETIFDNQAAEQKIGPKVRIVLLDQLEAKGSTAKAHVTDIKNGSRWLMKWGDEIHTDPVASRLFASLGYNVDHPYFFDSGKVTLLLGELPNKKKRTVQHFVRFIYNVYAVNLSPFILAGGKINKTVIAVRPELADFKGQYFIQFKNMAMEARPSSELRLSSMMISEPEQSSRRELRGALLAHLWLNSWDTKEDNTLLSIWMNNKGQTSLLGSYSDLGVSLGVNISKFPRDLKAGLVNSFSWDLVKKTGDQIRFESHMNYFSKAYRQATYEDLQWMARQIAEVNEKVLRTSLEASGWPGYLQELYFYKLAERRRQILEAFEVPDPYPMSINRNFSYQDSAGRWVVKDGELVDEPSLDLYPEGLLHLKGRFRGFGW